MTEEKTRKAQRKTRKPTSNELADLRIHLSTYVPADLGQWIVDVAKRSKCSRTMALRQILAEMRKLSPALTVKPAPRARPTANGGRGTRSARAREVLR